MNTPNKTELEYFIRYSLDSDKYKRYIELYDEIERLNNRIVALRETIRIANNNVLKDISMIKTIGMEKQEIIQRLFETSKILEGVDKEC